MEDVTGILARNLQAIRKEKQMTLQDLAELTGVSKSMLGEIERGASNPTITVLWKITTGLKIPISDLIYEKKPDYHMVHQEDWHVIQEGLGFTIAMIFEYNESRNFEIYHMDFEPYSRYISDSHQKGVMEYTMVYEGEMTLMVGDEVFRVGRGDSFLFEGDKVHSYSNEGDIPAKAYSCIYYRF